MTDGQTIDTEDTAAKLKRAIVQAIDIETSSFEEARERFERVISFMDALHREGFHVAAKFDISLHLEAPHSQPATS